MSILEFMKEALSVDDLGEHWSQVKSWREWSARQEGHELGSMAASWDLSWERTLEEECSHGAHSSLQYWFWDQIHAASHCLNERLCRAGCCVNWMCSILKTLPDTGAFRCSIIIICILGQVGSLCYDSEVTDPSCGSHPLLTHLLCPFSLKSPPAYI